MSKVYEIENCLETYIPSTLAEDWDNVGLLVGDRQSDITKVLLSVDITDSVISEAVEKGCNMIISHHPVIFSPIKSVRADSIESGRIYKLISLGIAAICIHTPLDVIEGGMNDKLCDKCSISDIKKIYDGESAIGRMGYSEAPMSVKDFAQSVKLAIGASGITYYDSGKAVNRVGVVTGAGGSFLQIVKNAGCDTLLTGEAKHNQFVDAKDLEINLVCAGHYYTELWGMDFVADKLNEHFGTLALVKSSSLNNLYQSI